MTPILFWALKGALFLLAVAMLCAVWRLLIGPTAQDRVMALDCLYINGMLMMLVLGLRAAFRAMASDRPTACEMQPQFREETARA